MAILKALKLKPDIAIVEISLPVVDGIEVTAHIHRQPPTTEVLIFTLLEHDALICDALAAVRAHLFKSEPHCHLAAAWPVWRSTTVFTDRTSNRLSRSVLARRRQKGDLAGRQRAVLNRLPKGIQTGRSLRFSTSV